MILKVFREPPIDNNNYLIIDEKTKEAALVDCSAIDDNIYKTLEQYNAKLKYILLTHGHFDHIAGIRNNPNIKVAMHKLDTGWLKKTNMFLPMFGMPEITIPEINIFIEENDIISLGSINLQVIHTPGHTQGGVCYYIEQDNGYLFSGDTIFRESVGRCDLEGGDFAQIVTSIKTKIFTLPTKTIIYPGHGKSTTVEWEIENNNFM